MSAIKRRRIVLSDDEDEDTGRNVSAAIASPQLIISPVQHNQHMEDSDASDVLPSSSRKSLRLSSGKKTRSMEKRFAAEKVCMLSTTCHFDG